jgi:hypothetical protein
MKKLKTTLFLLCGLMTAMSLSSCLGNSSDDNSNVTLNKSMRALYYNQIANNYSGHLYRVYSDSYTPADSLGPLSWNVNATDNDTTVNIQFPVNELATYINNTEDKAILSKTPPVPMIIQYRAPYTESQSVYNANYYRFPNYVTATSVSTTYNNTPIEIDFDTMSQTSTDTSGNIIYFFSSYSPIVYYNGSYEEIIDIKTIKIGSNSYSLGNGDQSSSAHFEIIYKSSTGSN